MNLYIYIYIYISSYILFKRLYMIITIGVKFSEKLHKQMNAIKIYIKFIYLFIIYYNIKIYIFMMSSVRSQFNQ